MRSSRIQRTLVSLAVLVACATSRTSATLPLAGTYWLTELNGKPAVTTGGSDQAHLRFVRDSALAASGLLVTRIGGPSTYPYQPDGIWDGLAGYAYPAADKVPADDHHRRALYSFAKRNAPQMLADEKPAATGASPSS